MIKDILFNVFVIEGILSLAIFMLVVFIPKERNGKHNISELFSRKVAFAPDFQIVRINSVT